eukprot:11101012-Lingulodinium_polyedra.AAC.1
MNSGACSAAVSMSSARSRSWEGVHGLLCRVSSRPGRFEARPGHCFCSARGAANGRDLPFRRAIPRV